MFLLSNRYSILNMNVWKHIYFIFNLQSTSRNPFYCDLLLSLHSIASSFHGPPHLCKPAKATGVGSEEFCGCGSIGQEAKIEEKTLS